MEAMVDEENLAGLAIAVRGLKQFDASGEQVTTAGSTGLNSLQPESARPVDLTPSWPG